MTLTSTEVVALLNAGVTIVLAIAGWIIKTRQNKLTDSHQQMADDLKAFAAELRRCLEGDTTSDKQVQ